MLESRSTLGQRAILLALALLFSALCYRLALNARRWGPELGAVNTLYRTRGYRPIRNDFLIVAINNQNPNRKLLDSKGRVSRSTLAALVRRAKAGGARAIVLDVYMPARSTRAVDRDLWKAIASTPQNVLLPAEYVPDRSNVLTKDDTNNLKYLEESVLTGGIDTYYDPPAEYTWWKFLPPVSDFTRSAAGNAGGVGVAANEPDPDGVVRRIRLTYQTDIVYPPTTVASRLIRQGNVTNVAVPSIVLPVVNWVTKVDKRLITVNYGRNVLYAGDLNPPINIPVDREGRMLINFVGPAGSFPAVNAADVLGGKVERENFDDKVVFIGINEGALADAHPTPFNPATQPAPRVYITANAVATVLDRAYPVQAVENAIVPLGFLALFLALTLPFFTAVGATIWALICALLYFLIALYVFRSPNYGILPLIPALLLIVLMWASHLAFRPIIRSRRVVVADV